MSNETRPPATPTTRTVWTQADEQRLQELLARKEAVHTEGQAALRDVFAGLGDMTPAAFTELVQYAACNAEALRDALLHFDNRGTK
jgi:hypothetical protein